MCTCVMALLTTLLFWLLIRYVQPLLVHRYLLMFVFVLSSVFVLDLPTCLLYIAAMVTFGIVLYVLPVNAPTYTRVSYFYTVLLLCLVAVCCLCGVVPGVLVLHVSPLCTLPYVMALLWTLCSLVIGRYPTVYQVTYNTYTTSQLITVSAVVASSRAYSLTVLAAVLLALLCSTVHVGVWFMLLSVVVLYTVCVERVGERVPYAGALLAYTTVLLLAMPSCICITHGTPTTVLLVVLVLEQHSYYAYRFAQPSYLLAAYVSLQFWLSALLWYGVLTASDIVMLAFVLKLGLSLVAVFVQLLYAELAG